MVDIVHASHVVHQVDQVADRSEDVRAGQVLRAEIRNSAARLFLQPFHVVAELFLQFAQHGNACLFPHAAVGQVIAEDILRLERVVADDLHLVAVVEPDRDFVHARTLDRKGKVAVDDVALVCKHLAGQGADDGLARAAVGNPAVDRHFLVVLIPTHGGNVVTLGVEEIVMQQGLRRLFDRRFARAQFLVDFLDGFHADGRAVCGCQFLALVALEGQRQSVVLAELLIDLLPRFQRLAAFEGEGAEEHGQRNFSGFIDADSHHAVRVDLILQPRASVRDDRGCVGLFTRLVDLRGIVHSRGTDDLGNNDALRAVDDERTRFGHQREIAHENFVFFDLSRRLVGQADRDPQRRGKVDVSFLALLNRILRVFGVKGVVNEFDLEVAGKVPDRRNVMQNLAQPLVKKPLVGFGLNFDQIRKRIVEAGSGKALSDVLTKSLLF